jgi:hypothetical protein
MSEKLGKELRQVKREMLKAREEYRTSCLNGIPNKQLYYKIIELEAQHQMLIGLMKKYYFVK